MLLKACVRSVLIGSSTTLAKAKSKAGVGRMRGERLIWVNSPASKPVQLPVGRSYPPNLRIVPRRSPGAPLPGLLFGFAPG